MILEIATIRIKLTFEHEYNLNTDYINKIIEMYKVGDTDEYDFEFKTIKRTEQPSTFYKMESRNEALYRETEDTFLFETESWASTIYWKNRLMTIMFFNKGFTHLEDRLFIGSLKLLISLLILKKGGLPLHCSAVSNNNQFCTLFSGQSYAGKTTIALLLHHKRKWAIFNDEFIIIKPHNGTYYVYSTPFTSPEKITFCSHGIAPLKKIFFLKKDIANRTEKMALKEKYFFVLGGTFTFPTSEYFGNILMETVEKIARNVPIEMLYFNNKSNIAERIDEFIK